MSMLPLANSLIDIKRGMTTSSTAIFVPFTTQELFQTGKEGLLPVEKTVIDRCIHQIYQRYYLDEMHLLLKEEQTAAYTVEIWKRFRKWGGIPTGIIYEAADLFYMRKDRRRCFRENSSVCGAEGMCVMNEKVL